jgi:PEP-CTERM motif
MSMKKPTLWATFVAVALAECPGLQPPQSRWRRPLVHSTFMHALALAASLGAVGASAQEYTDRSSFEAAAGSLRIETFEASPLVGTTSLGAVADLAFTDFSVSSDPTATKLLDTDHFFGSFNTTPGGKNYLLLDTDEGLLGSTATFFFSSAIHAIGFDYTAFDEPDSSFDLTVDGTTFALAPNTNSDSFGFWGYTSVAGFTSFSFSAATDSSYSFDQLTYSVAIPEPQTYALLLLGLGCIAAHARRRRARATILR